MDPHSAHNAYDCALEAFELSAQLSVPIIVRITGRLLNTQGVIERAPPARRISKGIDKSIWTLTHLGRHQHFLRDTYPKMVQFAETTDLNEQDGAGAIGIVSAGYASTVVDDAIQGRDDVVHLKLGVVNPPCERRIDSFLEERNRVLVVEEGSPLIEESVHAKVLGKLSGHVPRCGELTPNDVIKALTYIEADYISAKFDVETLETRPYTVDICDDCPFLPFYRAFGQVDAMIAGDMGCVIRTASPPFKLIDVAYSLGSAIGVASGFEQGGFAILGDYAFLHSGIAALTSAAVFKRNVKVFVLENQMSAITGGQPAPEIADLIGAVCRNYGITYKLVDAAEMNEMSFADLLRAANNSTGTLVVVIRAACPKYGSRQNSGATGTSRF
jgi:indolepyruvate ferredoxin oxidoreductase alpha subunit